MLINYSQGRRWLVSTLLAPLCFGLPNAFSSQSRRHYTTLPIDRNNGYDDSYRSHTNKPFGVLPTSLPSIVPSKWFLASYQTAEA